jgi:hypothetical protein
MNVDEAMEEARQFGEQESKDMLFAEHIAILLAAEVERLRAEVEILAVEVTRLQAIEHEQIETRTELAAAKAASVCPVKVVYCEPDYERTATVVLWTNADAQRFADWLNDRIKEGNER